MFYNNRLFISIQFKNPLNKQNSARNNISYLLPNGWDSLQENLKTTWNLNIFNNSAMKMRFSYSTKTKTEQQLHYADYFVGEYQYVFFPRFLLNLEAYFKPCQKSMVELCFAKIVKYFQLLSTFAKQINHRCLTCDH